MKDTTPDLAALFDAQRDAYAAAPYPDLKARKRNLDKLHNAILDYRDRLKAAICEDFSNRSAAETELSEILPSLENIHYYRKRLRALMAPERRQTPMSLMPGSSWVEYQPLGVIGVVVPWNFPVFLALSPLIGALAAGNRVMLKLSEFTPRTGEVLTQMLAETFGPDEVVALNGDADLAARFTALPFDHLVFTGSTAIGRKVMQAAAANLTPVTLELGGKSPAIVHESFPLEEAARRIAFGKCMNAGQICVAPDYVLVPKSKVQEFASAFAVAFARAYPTLRDNPDYTAIISERQQRRLENYLIDARMKGAEIFEINPAGEDLSGTRKMPMILVNNATSDMKLLREEIFGPILPIIAYGALEDALEFVNARERPLALYYFDYDRKRTRDVLRATHSGGVSVNETVMHVAADDLPFGGIGPSGMGHYHGVEGFRTFSKAKSVLRKGRFNATALVGPPWNNHTYKALIKLQNLRFRRRKIRE
ncbi:MAG: coniferyl-aldehyde dehydrogenase [Rhodobacterales bacterium]|nr:MAG: coniferyl-aldehyde dehydrogenase [Rhodobacterales bacterium]